MRLIFPSGNFFSRYATRTTPAHMKTRTTNGFSNAAQNIDMRNP